MGTIATENELTSEEQEELRVKQQCEFVIAGFKRCVEWLNENHEIFIRSHASIHPNQKTGAQIHLGTVYEADTELLALIKSVFSGKEATVKPSHYTSNDDRYEIVDEDLQITFIWSVYRAPVGHCGETRTVMM